MPLSRRSWPRFLDAIRGLWRSDSGMAASVMFTALIALLLAFSALNVLNSYVGRDFMTAIAGRHRFARSALLYLGVFVLSALVATAQRFTEERLGLVLRRYLADGLVDGYMAHRAYLRLDPAQVDNPDQRISEDVKTFTTTTLSFLIMILNGTITALAFAGVLWSISPLLFFASIAYAALGTGLTILLGHNLVGLNNKQLEKEANFRFELAHVREHAEPIALAGVEGNLKARLHRRLAALIDNAKDIAYLNRRLNFFTNNYNYLIQFIPVVIVAPLYLQKKVEFGVISQAMMAFAQVLGGFSLLVTQFQSLSTYAATISRLDALAEAIDAAKRLDNSRRAGHAGIAVKVGDKLAAEGLSLASADGRPLVERLDFEVLPGGRLLVVGSGGEAKYELFRTFAGVWDHGEGRVVRPDRDKLMFLPESPYASSGRLRDQFAAGADDGKIREALQLAELEALLDRPEGLDAERDWSSTLSVAERQQLAVARLLVAGTPFAILDRVADALGPGRAVRLYAALAATETALLSVGDAAMLGEFHDEILEIREDGTWELSAVARAVGAVNAG